MNHSDTLLKTRQVARALGVSISTIKRWVDSGVLPASRTVGKHRLIPLGEVIRFAREQGLTVGTWEALGGSRTPPVRVNGDWMRAALVSALREGWSREAKALIHSAHEWGQGAAALADQLISPVMEQIGHGWIVGALEVYHEHQASQMVASALSELIERAPRLPAGSAPLALGGAPEGDPHQLAGLLGELVLREAGWDVRFLGVNLPLRSLAGAVREYHPKLVYLTIHYLMNEDSFLQEYRRFHEIAGAEGSAVVVGGRALRPELHARLAFASFGDRMADLEEFARRLLPAAAVSASGRRDRPSTEQTHTKRHRAKGR